jgi:tetratricopeptide (TPR) repeat protein
MAKSGWVKFPHGEAAYRHEGAALKKAWDRLHRGDCEPFPKDEASQDAWRLYHAGEFEKAVEAGLAAGTASGVNAANKAQSIYATYLEKSDAKRLKLFEEAMERAEESMAEHPKDANAHYFFALAAGRYSQGISIATALKKGLGGKIKTVLDHAIKLQPKHADAHIALGTWHAEIIGKVGAMVGGLTYGAKKDASVEHFQKALKLNPDSAIARVEYANALVEMFGKDRMKEAEKLYAEATKVRPADAMERLDVELAKSEMDD